MQHVNNLTDALSYWSARNTWNEQTLANAATTERWTGLQSTYIMPDPFSLQDPITISFDNDVAYVYKVGTDGTRTFRLVGVEPATENLIPDRIDDKMHHAIEDMLEEDS